MSLSEAAARRLICDTGRWLWEKGYLAAADGNLSIRLGARLVITPSGLSKGHLRPDQLLITDLDGRPVPGTPHGLRPSTETRMHVAAYRERPDVGAVVHAHPPTSVALSLAGIGVAGDLLPEVLYSLGCIPTLPYTTPSSQANADVITAPIRTHDALILSHHGTLTVGPDLHTAYLFTERVEHSAAITHQALALSGLRPLPPGELEHILHLRQAAIKDHPVCPGASACPFNTLYAATAARFGAPASSPAPERRVPAPRPTVDPASDLDARIRHAAGRLARR